MSEVAERLLALLAANSNLTARELAWRLRSSGTADVGKRDVNPVLYRDDRFCSDDGTVPRWRLKEQAQARPSTEDRVAAKREKRRNLDVRQDQVRTARDAGAERRGFDESDLAAAVALLRKHGVEVPDSVTAPASAPSVADGRTGRGSPTKLPVPQSPARDAVPVPSWRVPGLRPWQQEALEAWFRAGCVGVCEAVTGTGKTHLGLEAVAQTVALGGRATVLVPSVLLQRQWELRLEEFVPQAVIAKVGGVATGHPGTADVVVAVVHSASQQDLTAWRRMDLLVADEVHRYGSATWQVALRDGYSRRLGLTATLERSSDDGVADLLLPYFREVVHSYGYGRATAEAVVAPFDLLFLGVDLDPDERLEHDALSGRISQARKVMLAAGANPATLNHQLGRMRGMGGQVARAAMAYEQSTRARRRLLAGTPSKVDALRRLADYVQESDGTVVFSQGVQTAVAAADALRSEGCTAAAVHGKTSDAARQKLIDDLGDGALQALAAPKILDEGVDVPDINLGVVMGASSSRRQMIQRLGRVIRLKADGGRARFVVLYVTDSVEDPETGARQDFMDEVEGAAARVVLHRQWDEDDLDAAWDGLSECWSLPRDDQAG